MRQSYPLKTPVITTFSEAVGFGTHLSVIYCNLEMPKVSHNCWQILQRNIKINQRREVICVKWQDTKGDERWKVLRATWDVDTSEKA